MTKKYLPCVFLAILVFSLVFTKTYQFKSREQPNVTFVCTEPVWMYWIHKVTVGAEPVEQ
jgi:hypothetical protein